MVAIASGPMIAPIRVIAKAHPVDAGIGEPSEAAGDDEAQHVDLRTLYRAEKEACEKRPLQPVEQKEKP